MSNRVNHFEIPCNDPEKTMAFFKKVFGWTFKQYGDEPYWMAFTGEEGEPGINGAISQKRDPNQPITNNINVKDLDTMTKEIETHGGITVVPKTAVPGMGWFSYFKDPDGNIHGIWQDDDNAS